MGNEQLVWGVAFEECLRRGDAAVEAAHAANNAVLVYRGGPLGARVPGTGEDLDKRAMVSALRDLKLAAQQVASGAAMGAGVLGQGELRGAGNVSELLRFPDLETPAKAREPLFKVGDRVLVSTPDWAPFYDTVAGMQGTGYVRLLGRPGYCVPVEHVKHAPEVSHDQC